MMHASPVLWSACRTMYNVTVVRPMNPPCADVQLQLLRDCQQRGQVWLGGRQLPHSSALHVRDTGGRLPLPLAAQPASGTR
jgi:hypothetical protein